MHPEDQAPQGGRIDAPRSVLMADIVNSTLMYERLGDLRARELVGSGMEAMVSAVSEHGGRLVKSMGDGILACFEGAGATPAGLEICRRVSNLILEARVGVHHGTVIDDDDGDIFGDTVNTAARLASAARPCEVLISKQVWEQLPDNVRELCRSIPPIGVKGKAKPVEVYSIFTQAEDCGQTMLQEPVSRQQSMEASNLELRLGEVRLVLDGPGSYVIGRGQECDIRVDNERTSRAHAKVFLRGSAFMLEDSSTNGTTVLPDSGAAVRIHRRDTALFGRGKIYLGSKPGSPGAMAVEYYVS